eukprot:403356550
MRMCKIRLRLKLRHKYFSNLTYFLIILNRNTQLYKQMRSEGDKAKKEVERLKIYIQEQQQENKVLVHSHNLLRSQLVDQAVLEEQIEELQDNLRAKDTQIDYLKALIATHEKEALSLDYAIQDLIVQHCIDSTQQQDLIEKLQRKLNEVKEQKALIKVSIGHRKAQNIILPDIDDFILPNEDPTKQQSSLLSSEDLRFTLKENHFEFNQTNAKQIVVSRPTHSYKFNNQVEEQKIEEDLPIAKKYEENKMNQDPFVQDLQNFMLSLERKQELDEELKEEEVEKVNMTQDSIIFDKLDKRSLETIKEDDEELKDSQEFQLKEVNKAINKYKCLDLSISSQAAQRSPINQNILEDDEMEFDDKQEHYPSNKYIGENLELKIKSFDKVDINGATSQHSIERTISQYTYNDSEIYHQKLSKTQSQVEEEIKSDKDSVQTQVVEATKMKVDEYNKEVAKEVKEYYESQDKSMSKIPEYHKQNLLNDLESSLADSNYTLGRKSSFMKSTILAGMIDQDFQKPQNDGSASPQKRNISIESDDNQITRQSFHQSLALIEQVIVPLPQKLRKEYQLAYSKLTHLAYNHTGSDIAVYGEKLISIIDLATNDNSRFIKIGPHVESVTSLSYAKNHDYLIIGTSDSQVQIVQAKPQLKLITKFNSDYSQSSIALQTQFMNSDQYGVIATTQNLIKIWDLKTTMCFREINYKKSQCTALNTENSQNIIYSGHQNGFLLIHDLRMLFSAQKVNISSNSSNMANFYKLNNLHTDRVTSIQFISDKNQLLTSSIDNSLKLVDLRMNAVIKGYSNPNNYISQNNLNFSGVHLNSIGRKAYAIGDNSRILSFDMPSLNYSGDIQINTSQFNSPKKIPQKHQNQSLNQTLRSSNKDVTQRDTFKQFEIRSTSTKAGGELQQQSNRQLMDLRCNPVVQDQIALIDNLGYLSIYY